MSELTTQDLESILKFTVTFARTAGDLILEGSEAIQSVTASKDVNEKKNSVDLVTEYDVRVEELVKKEIAQKYPTFKLCVPSFCGWGLSKRIL
jgi:myo-inositol-1(or 4)-monophosphatase